MAAYLPRKVVRNAVLLLNVVLLLLLCYLLFWLGSDVLQREQYGESRKGTRKPVIPPELAPALGPIAEESLVVNLGKLHCFHIWGLPEACWAFQRVFRKTAFDMVAQRTWVPKDLIVSRTQYRFGRSEYLYYDWITVAQLAEMSQQGLPAGSRGIVDISARKLENSVSVGNLYVATEPWDLSQVGRGRYVSAVTVLFGEDCVEPRSNWRRDEIAYRNNRGLPAYIDVARAQVNSVQTKPQLRVGADGKFKIVQLADLHLVPGKGECRDEYPPTDNCEADVKTMKFVNDVLDIEKPDMVVYTGDQITGDLCTNDAETPLLKAFAPAIQRRIPFAVIWGNHDDAGSLNRLQLSQYVEGLPYSLFKIGPRDTMDRNFGMGNYIHQVLGENGHPEITFYFVDTHSYAPNPRGRRTYDWVKEEQWQYFEECHEQLEHTDLSLAFLHIPLPEYLSVKSKKNPENYNQFVGTFREGVTAPRYNSGGAERLAKLGVAAVTAGHDHCNDYCLQTDFSTIDAKIWMCYGGAAGEGGYGGYGGTERRVRIFEIDTRDKRIETWKRLNGSPNDRFDAHVIYP
ncbi:AaceriABL009Wp [[Ashbya] aceris (nom. inval.)]|nr:AaceriABL009Wp [[Ashbya] aceris (nom. inval.)]